MLSQLRGVPAERSGHPGKGKGKGDHGQISFHRVGHLPDHVEGIYLRVLKYLVKELKVDEEAKNAWYRHWVRDGLVSFERQLQALADRRQQAGLPACVYCYGDRPTLADCCLVPQIFNGKRFDVNLDGLPLTMAAFDACMKLVAFQQAQPANCPDNEG